jgi:hypothetical protein
VLFLSFSLFFLYFFHPMNCCSCLVLGCCCWTHLLHKQTTTSSSSCTVCFAKHANDKAAKWAASKRPKKSRPSDINRKPIEYELHTMTKPAEYNIDSAAPEPVAAKKAD